MNTLFKRTSSTLLLLGTLSGAVFFPYKIRIICFLVLCLVLSSGMTWEICQMINKDKHLRFINVFSSTIIFAVVITDYILFERILRVSILEIIIFCLLTWGLILLLCKKEDHMIAVLKNFMVVVSFSVSIKAIMYFYISDNDPTSIPATFLFFILATKSGDIGAYLFGTLCNTISHGKNHKLIPSVSPGKSWEGFVGGLIFTLMICLLLIHFLPSNQIGLAHNNYLATTFVGILLFIGGVLGDLSESSIKRTFGVKDSGYCLPGIGGLFDLTDSLIVNSLVFYLILVFLRS